MKLLVLVGLAVGAAARAAPSSSAEPDPALEFAVEVDGKTFVNKVRWMVLLEVSHDSMLL